MLTQNKRWQKTQLSTMNSDETRCLLGKCIQLKYSSYGVFAADNFPKLTGEGFIIVNASSRQYERSHWMVILFHENKAYFADPLGIPIQNHQLLYCRLVKIYNEVTQILKLKPIQNQNSKLCRIFAFILRMWFYGYPLIMNMNNNDLLRFANHML